MATKIEWTDERWNPVTGCTPISPGCAHCYAAAIAKRFWGDRKFSDVQFHEDRLDLPLHWRKPRMVFVNSMGDLFHEQVSFEQITRVFDIMASWRWPNKTAERRGDETELVDPGHIYQVLTKRPQRIAEWRQWLAEYWPGNSPINVGMEFDGRLPRHIWMGVTAENQEWADKWIPVLLQVPAAVRFVSLEPLLSGIFFDSPEQHNWLESLNWVIVGCETGPGARPCPLQWIDSIVEQCHAAQVPVFVKAIHVPNGRGGVRIVKDINHISQLLARPPEELRQWPQRRSL